MIPPVIYLYTNHIYNYLYTYYTVHRQDPLKGRYEI